MKHIYIISLGGLILLMSMFFIVATIQANNKYRFKKSAAEMLDEVSTRHHFINTAELNEMMKASEYVLIDIRTPGDFVGFHIEGAVNIPFERLLDEANESLFSNSSPKILYGKNSILANSAWMVLTQYGYENISVLNGGLSSWQEPQNQEKKPILDEQAAYDYAAIMKGDQGI
ncbi:MAG: rhodanese-like domain-containing protein [Cyclobacteriaceae bacterium]|nr:rhodanese-like domain-containing protein [Cyclobacteriaceae bacterium]